MAIEVKNLTFNYGQNSKALSSVALDDVSLTINEGEFYGIIGHTGSGKSTFIQHLNGLIKLSKDNGSIKIFRLIFGLVLGLIAEMLSVLATVIAVTVVIVAMMPLVTVILSILFVIVFHTFYTPMFWLRQLKAQPKVSMPPQ